MLHRIARLAQPLAAARTLSTSSAAKAHNILCFEGEIAQMSGRYTSFNALETKNHTFFHFLFWGLASVTPPIPADEVARSMV